MLIPMKMSIHTDSYSFLCVKKGLDCCFLTMAWKIPWMEEPGRLQSMGSLRVGQD